MDKPTRPFQKVGKVNPLTKQTAKRSPRIQEFNLRFIASSFWIFPAADALLFWRELRGQSPGVSGRLEQRESVLPV